ncbi:MAG: hypothetical protein ACE5GX_03595 [Thermoanaerobaculia bacterium]
MIGKQPTTVILGLVLTCVLALWSAGWAAAVAAAEWRHDAVWDDGNAEFCAYEIEWQRYGRGNPGTALLIAVKEPWAPDLEVKADAARPDGFEVLKLNHVRDVPTGIYTYHQMASTFVRRDTGRLQKLAVTSSEGCGVSTAQMVDSRLNTRSYFDGQGESTVDFEQGALPRDGLALVLRDFLDGPLPGEVSVFPTLMTGRFPELLARSYGIDRRIGERDVPAGSFETIELELAPQSRGAAGWMRFAFAREAPHPLVYSEDRAGTVYRLLKCERIPYWRMNGPEGEDWLPKALR